MSRIRSVHFAVRMDPRLKKAYMRRAGNDAGDIARKLIEAYVAGKIQIKDETVITVRGQ